MEQENFREDINFYSIEEALVFIGQNARRPETWEKYKEVLEEYNKITSDFEDTEGYSILCNDLRSKAEELATELNNGVPVHIVPYVSPDIANAFNRAGKMSDSDFERFMDNIEYGAPRI